MLHYKISFTAEAMTRQISIWREEFPDSTPRCITLYLGNQSAKAEPAHAFKPKTGAWKLWFISNH